MRTSSSSNNIKNFWTWFTKNEEVLKNMFAGTLIKSLRDELNKQLKNIHPDISFDLGSINSSKITFVISASDDEPLFSIVEDTINSAPQLKNWDFVAFRPRHPRKEFSIMINEDITISYSDLFFEPLQNADKFNAKLFIRSKGDYFLKNRTPIAIMLHDIVGEYDNIKHIHWESWEILEETTEKKLYPIIEIIQQLDDFKEGK